MGTRGRIHGFANSNQKMNVSKTEYGQPEVGR
jgi:hypothetical protein